jgi:hypothetical protein
VPAGPTEVAAIHTGILRLALAVEDSRAYWEQLDPSIPPPERPKVAFEQRWFGAKSLERVRYLCRSFMARYDAFPNALSVLHRCTLMDLPTRQAICHWHLQLSDPIYRRFTSELLVERRRAKVDRGGVVRWVKSTYPGQWAEATQVQFASKLLSAALEAGLVSKRDPRTVLLPKVGDHALAYLLYLLRETRFEGALTRNPYLASVGLDEDLLAARAKTLPGVNVGRMMGLWEFDWAYPDLASWAVEVVS